MTDEEKNAINIIKEFKDTGYASMTIRYNRDAKGVTRMIENSLKTLLNLIEKQEKVIDEMAKAVYDYANLGTMGICPAEIENGCINFYLCEYFGKKDINCLKCVKQYFYRKVENK